MIRYFQTPTVGKNFIIIKGLVYMATALLPVGDTIMQYCALSLGTPYFHTYQFITYMFLHANFEHIFFNMFALWMFGRTLEYELGSQRFLTAAAGRRVGRGDGPAAGVRRDASQCGHHAADSAYSDEGQVVRHHLCRHRAVPRMEGRGQRGSFRPCGRHAVGIPADALLETPGNAPFIDDGSLLL